MAKAKPKAKKTKPRKVRARKTDTPELHAAGLFITKAKANGGVYDDGLVRVTITDDIATIDAPRLGVHGRTFKGKDIDRAEELAAPEIWEETHG